MPALLADARDGIRYGDAIRRYAWVDIRLRFDRTVLGPLWVVVTSLAWVFSVGLVMSELFGQSLAENLPYLAFSVFSWQYISASIMEGATAFVGQKHFVGAYNLPLTFFVFRTVVRNALILGMLTLISLVVAVAFGTFHLSAIPNTISVLLVFILISVPLTVILACLGARFLDLPPALMIVMNIMILVTPIFWQKNLLPADHPLVVLNPFVPILDLYRDTFLHGAPAPRTYLVCLGIFLVLTIIATVIYQVTRLRIRTWL